MKKSRTYKALCAALTICITIGMLGACSNDKPTSGTSSKANTSDAADASGGEKAVSREAYEFTYYFNYDWYDISMKWGEDKVSQTMKEKFNIDVKLAKPDTDPAGKLNTMIASDSLPDVIYMDRDDSWNKMIKLGKFVSLNQWLDKYPGVTDNIEQSTINLLEADGQLYGVPNWSRRAATGGNSGFAYVKNIYEKVGSPSLASMDDVFSYAMAVKEQVKDVGGKKVVPIQAQDPGSMLSLLYRSFGGFEAENNSGFTIVDGKMSSKFKDTKFKDAVLYMNKLWQNGLINQDIYAETADQVAEKLAAGSVGMFMGEMPKMLDTKGCRKLLIETDPTNDYCVVDYPLSTGVTTDKYYGDSVYSTGGSGLICITNKAKNPERIFEWLSWMLTKEGSILQAYGPKGEMWDELDANGNPILKKFESDLSEEENRSMGLWKWCIPGQSDNMDEMKFAINDALPIEKQNWVSTIQTKFLSPRMWIADEFAGTKTSIEKKSDLGISRERINEYINKNLPQAVMAATTAECEKIFADILAFSEKNGLAEVEAAYTKLWENNKTIIGKSNTK